MPRKLYNTAVITNIAFNSSTHSVVHTYWNLWRLLLSLLYFFFSVFLFLFLCLALCFFFLVLFHCFWKIAREPLTPLSRLLQRLYTCAFATTIKKVFTLFPFEFLYCCYFTSPTVRICSDTKNVRMTHGYVIAISYLYINAYVRYCFLSFSCIKKIGFFSSFFPIFISFLYCERTLFASLCRRNFIHIWFESKSVTIEKSTHTCTLHHCTAISS